MVISSQVKRPVWILMKAVQGEPTQVCLEWRKKGPGNTPNVNRGCLAVIHSLLGRACTVYKASAVRCVLSKHDSQYKTVCYGLVFLTQDLTFPKQPQKACRVQQSLEISGKLWLMPENDYCV